MSTCIRERRRAGNRGAAETEAARWKYCCHLGLPLDPPLPPSHLSSNVTLPTPFLLLHHPHHSLW
ncbi:hypothetical protein EYF80_008151 [Liparis tanakae]|uniref:Uncharacterized protein n=1 Tax=Liparis tanakae TaxID=230148 RepID=A0A4Z2IUU4_9TELE|nr:hypothetical protein EYF80_008151 [Liparis tanakae]